MAVSSSSSEEVSALATSSSSEAVSSSSEAPVAPAAVNKLPAGSLTGDVGLAAPGSTVEGYGYIGVWAKDAAGCAAIGTPAEADFAVITVSTFRNGPSASFGNFKKLVDGKTTLSMGGSSGQKTVALEQSSPDALTIDGTALVRCSP
jgi:hypothetical protein